MSTGNEKVAFDESFEFFQKYGYGAARNTNKGMGATVEGLLACPTTNATATSTASSLASRSTPAFTLAANSNYNTNNNNTSLDVSFESDPFEFTAITLRDDHVDAADAFPLFAADPFSVRDLSVMPVEMQTVRVNIREQLVAFYDDGVSMEGSVRVEGCVQVEPLIGSTIINTSFDLVVRDLLEQVEQVDIVDVSCQDASHSISQHGLHHTDRVFHVMGQSLSSRQRDDTGSIALLNYTCTPALRPVPLLVKSRVRCSRDHTRVGIKIRANPSNEFPLSRLAILLAIPPDIDGDSARLSRQGGLWDEMKRTLSWSVPILEPGEALDIQAQFVPHHDLGSKIPAFPALVRCEYPKLFSAIEVFLLQPPKQSKSGEGTMLPPQSLQMQLAVSARVLHRKL